MEVILKEDVDTQGHRGDVVKVADAYGRNFLLPKKLAIEATAANRNVIEQMKQSAVRRSAKEKADAQQQVAQMEQGELVFTREGGQNSPAVRLGPLPAHRARAGEEGLPARPPKGAAGRATEATGRVPHSG